MNKLQRLQNLLFLLVIVLLPFNARHIFNFQSIQQIESFREHLTFSLFAFDVPIIALVVLISIEAYQIYMHSMKVDSTTYEMREYSINRTHLRTVFKNPFTYYFLVLFFSSTLAHNNIIALYNSFRLLQASAFFLVAVYLFNNRKNILSHTVAAVFISGIFQSIIALFQFLVQRSLGLDFLGESILGRNILGVAKFEFAGEKFIRAYGTFPHPNLLGYFLLISLACGIWLAIQKDKKRKSVPTIAALAGSLVVVSGLLLSYSRSIALSSAILILIMVISYKDNIIEIYRSFCNKIKIPTIIQGAFAILLVFSSLFIVYNLLAPRLCINKCPGDYSFEMRDKYNSYASTIITKHTFLGVGAGNFVPYLKSNYIDTFKPWEFQPAHNIYFLITAEIGIIGLISFLIIIFFVIIRSGFTSRDLAKNPFGILFFLTLLIGFVDHYHWTLVQGQMSFWLMFAFYATIKHQSIFNLR